MIKLIYDDLQRIRQRTHTNTHARFRDVVKIRGPKFESLIKRRVTFGLGMTMILLPRHRLLTLMSFNLIPSSKRGSRSPFQFWHCPSWWFIKMITRTALTPPRLPLTLTMIHRKVILVCQRILSYVLCYISFFARLFRNSRESSLLAFLFSFELPLISPLVSLEYLFYIS